MQPLTVKDIMVTDVVSVGPETSLIEAAKTLAERHFDGLPVVDGKNKLIGILTEYDLVSKGSALHLPTFQFILQNLKILHEDRAKFEEEVKDISGLKVKDVMNTEPLTVREDTTFEEIAKTFRDHHRVNPIPVVTPDNQVIGVVSRFDILKPLRLAA